MSAQVVKIGRTKRRLSNAALMRWQVMNLTSIFEHEKALALDALRDLKARCYGSRSLEMQARSQARRWGAAARKTFDRLRVLIETGKAENEGGAQP